MDTEGEKKLIFLIGLVSGILLTVLAFILVAELVEGCKVNAGYLTYNDKTYTVTLYDTLDTPEKVDK